jgi:hypothetical protein
MTKHRPFTSIGRALLLLAVTLSAVLSQAAAPPARFSTAQLFSVGADFRQDLTVFWLAYGDFNGDGKLDLVSADASGPAFSVMLGNGDGTFQPGNVIFLPDGSPAVEYVVVGDVNQDGKQDVLVRTASAPSLVFVYLGDGRGGFSLAGTYTTGNSGYGNLHGMTLADLRGIGKVDIIATNRDDNTISVLLGNGDGTFQSQISYSVGPVNTAPLDVAVGDFNKDGHLDVVTVDASNGISVLQGNGNGSFQAPTLYTGGYSVSGVAVADLNRDGNLDIVISSWYGATVFLGTGGGAFAPGVSYGVPFGNSIAIGDLNGDKKLDIVIADQYDSTVYALLGKGDGTFKPAVGYAIDWNSQSIVLADFNGDGKLDVAVGNSAGALGTVALGNGDGTFRASSNYAFSSDTAITIGSADFNHDGTPDVVLAGNAPNTLSILLSDSHGVLGTPTPIVITDQGWGVTGYIVATGDFNHDGKADIVVATRGGLGNEASTEVAVLLGTGTGKFKPAVFYSMGDTSGSGDVKVADVNGDAKPDLIVSNADGNLSVLLGKGNGTFNPAVVTPVPSESGTPGPPAIATGDFNHDGKLDVALTNYVGSTVEILFGDGDGMFQPAVATAGLQYPQAIVPGDFNKDGKTDLAVASGANGGEVGIFLNNGNGTFSGPNIFAYIPAGYGGGTSPSNIKTADVNGDGVPDLLVTLNATHVNATCGYFPDCLEANLGLVVMLGDGNGGLAVTPGGPFLVGGSSPGWVTVGDFDNDGMPDAAVLNNWVGYTEVTMLLNRTLPVSVSPISITYASRAVGTSNSQTVVVTNDLSSTLSISSITLAGADPADFSFKSACGTSLKTGAHCTITVTFKPTVGGIRTASLVIADNAPGGSQTVQLSGEGLAMQVSPASLKFGTVTVGQTSPPQNVTVTNISSAVVNITGIMITGAAAADYSQSNNCGASLGAGQSCTVTVRFTPSKTGARNASLQVNDNGGGSPQKVSLSGTGS